jgi:microcin C transport system permease protein
MQQKLARFKNIKRAFWSFWILAISFGLSLLGPVVAGSKPLLLKSQDQWYVPVLSFYSGAEFGQGQSTEVDYDVLLKDSSQVQFVIMPLVPFDPLTNHLDLEGSPPHAPSYQHILGTDASARDVLSRVIHGYRIGMGFAVLMTITGVFFGILIGGLQGYLGGKVDLFFQRIIEIWSALPFLYIVILVGSLFGRSFAILVGIMALFSWIGLSYFMRAEFLKVKNQTFVKASFALGLSPWHRFWKEILPNTLTPIITLLPFMVIGGLSSLTALDFLGFGLQPPTPSWGELLQEGLANLHAPWLSITAVSILFVTLMLCTFVGEGLREAFDPKADI